jgi:hypothetical protein
MQLRSKWRDQDPQKDRPLTPHFVVSVAWGPDVAKVRSLTDLCGLRVKEETYKAPKRTLQCKRCQRFGHTQRNCGYAPSCVACGDAHPSGKCVTPKQQLKCCSCGGNHTADYRGCSSWKEAKASAAKRAQGERDRKDGVSTSLPAPKSAPAKPSTEQENLALAGTTLSEAAASSRLRLSPALPPLHPTQEDGPSGRLPQRAVNVSPLVLKCWWWSPSHPVPKTLIQHPLPHRVSLRSRGSPTSSGTFPLRPA